MKISIFGPSHPLRGGIAHHTSLLTRHLQPEHEVQIINYSRLYPEFLFPGKTQLDESENPLAAPSAVVVDSINPFTWIKAANLIKGFDPDLLLIQWWNPFFAPCCATIGGLAGRRQKTTVGYICHNVLPHESSAATQYFNRVAFAPSSFFIVHSQEDLENLHQLKPGAIAHKTPLPTYDIFAEGAMPRAEARARLGIASDARVVMFFGLIRSYKGLGYLIDAFPGVRQDLNAELWIVGEFYEDKDAYLQQIRERGIENVTHVVDQYVPNEEVGLYLSAADVLVLPYVTATQSAIVQIAYGFERPAITTNVGGLPEVVLDDVTGYVVPPKNSEALTAAILRFFAEDKAEVFSANIRREQEKYSWARMVELVEMLAETSKRG